MINVPMMMAGATAAPPAVPIDCKVVTGAIGTGAAGTQKTWSGFVDRSAVNFTPKAYLSLRTEKVSPAGYINPGSGIGGIGFGVSGGERSLAWCEANNALSSVARASSRGDCVAERWIHNNDSNGRASLASFAAGDIVEDIDDQYGVSELQIRFGLGGTALTGAKIITISEPGATGNQDYSVTGLGGTPGGMIAIGMSSATALPTSRNDSIVMVGIAAADLSQAVYAGGSNFGADPSVDLQYFISGEFLAAINSTVTAIISKGVLTAVANEQITINWTQVSGSALLYHILVLCGGNYEVKTFTLGPNLNDTVDVLTSAEPRGGFLMTANARTAFSASGTPTAEDFSPSFGVFDSITSRATISTNHNHNDATMSAAAGFFTDAVLHNGETGSGLTGKWDVSAIASDRFTLKTTDADAALVGAALVVMDG